LAARTWAGLDVLGADCADNIHSRRITSAIASPSGDESGDNRDNLVHRDNPRTVQDQDWLGARTHAGGGNDGLAELVTLSGRSTRDGTCFAQCV
jgi:hypothetical protein